MSKAQEAIELVRMQDEIIEQQQAYIKNLRAMLFRAMSTRSVTVPFSTKLPCDFEDFSQKLVDGWAIIQVDDFKTLELKSDFQRIKENLKKIGK